MNGILFLTASLFCFATSASLVWVNSRRVINQASALASLLAALSYSCAYIATIVGSGAYPRAELLFWLRTSSAAFAFLPWTLWLMKNAIVAEQTSLFFLIKRSWLWFSGSCLLALVCFTDFYIPPDSTPANPQRGIGYVFFMVGMSALSGSIFWSAYRTMRKISGVRRIETQFFLLNMCAACLVVIILTSIGRILHIPALVYAGPLVVITLFSILVWAVSYHRVFDARHVMISLGQRIAMLAVLGGGALGLITLLTRFVAHPANLFLGVVLAGVITFFCDQKTRKWLGLDPEDLLAEPRAKIIGWSRTEPDPEKLRELFEKFLRDWCQTDLAELLVARGSAYAGSSLALANHGFVKLCHHGWVTPEHLQRLRPELAIDESLGLMSSQGLAAVIAVPRGSSSPSLLVALGPKHSLRPYTYPDIILLLSLAELMDNILSHSRLSAHAAKIARMESVAMMSRGLAHDLNNLTTPVSTYLLHREGMDKIGTTEAEVYNAARHSIKVMQDYIRESLFFARRLIPEFKEVDPGEVLASVVRLAHERAARRGIELRVVPGESLRFAADPVLVQRLVLNLVNNAIDASMRGALVEISAANRNQEQICLVVADQGSGIPTENIKRIFDPYFTTKDTGDEVRGLGLGLAICRKIADLHGGEIEVSSVIGQGTTFTAIFPKKPARRTREELSPDNSIASAAYFDSNY